MPDESLDILIRTKSDLKGATEAAGALDQVTAAVKKDSGAMEEAAKKTSFLSLKKAELKKLVRELGHEFPIAGMAAKAMMNPIVASLTIAIGVFSKAKVALDDWNKAMDESQAKAAEKDFLPGIEAKSAAMKEAAASAITFYRSVEDATKKEDAFTTSLKQAKDALHEYITAQAEVDDASKANELARVDLAEEKGDVSSTDAIAARREIGIRYRKNAEDLKTQAENTELANYEAELANANINREAIKQAEAEARAKLESKKAAIAKARLNEPNLKKRLEDAEKEAAEKLDAQAAAEQYEGTAASGLGLPGATHGPTQLHIDEARTAATEAIRRRDAIKRALHRNTGIGNSDTAWEEANLGLATGRVTANESTIDRLSRENSQTRANFQMRQDARRTVSGIKDDTERVGFAGDLKNANKKLTEQIQKGDKEAAEMIKSAGTLGKTQIEAMNKLRQEFQDNIAELKVWIGNGRYR